MTTSAKILRPEATAITCAECGTLFELPYATLAKFVRVCPTCSERHAFEDQRQAVLSAKRLRAERWRNICPQEFLESSAHRLPHPDRLERLLKWRYGPRGLMLHGPTGAGKSRCAWLLLKREFEAGRTVGALNSTAGLTYAAKYGDSATEVARWIDRLTGVDLALLDDVFKCKLTDSFEAAVFTIINERTEHRLPIMVTTQDTGRTLLERLSPDRGEALVRRLREFCEDFPFPD